MPRRNPHGALALFVLVTGCASPAEDDQTATSAGSTSAASSSSATSTGAGGAAERPSDLVDFLTGEDADARVTPLGPGLVLMGGGADVDAAFAWWKPRIAGGDVVVLRASGADGYNDYLFSDIGGADSVETMLVTTRALADAPYVADRIANAEGIFIAGGDQAAYVETWKGTALEDAIRAAYGRGAIVGGTSAGCDVLSSIVYSALNGTVYSTEALADPYNPYMTFEPDFLGLAPTTPLVIDTHFHERDRMGRLVGFMARTWTDGLVADIRGIGIDEATALVVDAQGHGEVVGAGHVYVVDAAAPPDTCVSGQALEWSGLERRRLSPGDTVDLPLGGASAAPTPLATTNGQMVPADPYGP
ncbi:MAG: cyanophycinase [Polyangiaceae bacterium]